MINDVDLDEFKSPNIEQTDGKIPSTQVTCGSEHEQKVICKASKRKNLSIFS